VTGGFWKMLASVKESGMIRRIPRVVGCSSVPSEKICLDPHSRYTFFGRFLDEYLCDNAAQQFCNAEIACVKTVHNSKKKHMILPEQAYLVKMRIPL
jgi:hypothetical protein